MKKIYSFLFLILFITASLASDDEGYSYDDDYYDGMMDELGREGRRLLNSTYYDPAATYPFHQASESRVLTVIGKSKTLFDFLNDGETEKALNFSVSCTLDERRARTLVHLSQFIKDNAFDTILTLTFFLDTVFDSSDPESFDVEVFKSKLLECETHNQKKFIEAEKKHYELPG